MTSILRTDTLAQGPLPDALQKYASNLKTPTTGNISRSFSTTTTKILPQGYHSCDESAKICCDYADWDIRHCMTTKGKNLVSLLLS